jgi:hypothetical protein
MAGMGREEYLDGLITTLQVFTEKVIRDAAKFGYQMRETGKPLEEVRIESVTAIHDQLEASFGIVRSAIKEHLL